MVWFPSFARCYGWGQAMAKRLLGHFMPFATRHNLWRPRYCHHSPLMATVCVMTERRNMMGVQRRQANWQRLCLSSHQV
jgi:hypothetical protein